MRPRVVYIAGSSFSGSTLLGLMLGTDDSAVFVGEANQCTRHWTPRNDGYSRECTCGKPIDTCTFWSTVRRRYQSDVDFNPAPGFSLLNLRHMLRILSPLSMPKAATTATPYGSLLESITEAAGIENPRLRLIIDSSKTIHSLDALARSPNVDVVVVHLIRDCVAVADSYKARGRSGTYGILAWALVNVLVRMCARRRRLPVITIDYRSLCTSTDAELARLNRSLCMSLIADQLPDRIRSADYHVFSGNKQVRLRLGNISRIEYRGDAGRLGRLERFAAAIMHRLVYRALRIPSHVSRAVSRTSRPTEPAGS